MIRQLEQKIDTYLETYQNKDRKFRIGRFHKKVAPVQLVTFAGSETQCGHVKFR